MRARGAVGRSPRRSSIMVSDVLDRLLRRGGARAGHRVVGAVTLAGDPELEVLLGPERQPVRRVGAVGELLVEADPPRHVGSTQLAGGAGQQPRGALRRPVTRRRRRAGRTRAGARSARPRPGPGPPSRRAGPVATASSGSTNRQWVPRAALEPDGAGLGEGGPGSGEEPHTGTTRSASRRSPRVETRRGTPASVSNREASRLWSASEARQASRPALPGPAQTMTETWAAHRPQDRWLPQ